MKTQSEWQEEYRRNVDARNVEGIREAASHIEWEAETLKAGRDAFGKKFLIENNYNLTKAKAKYGENWLNER